MMAVVLIFLAVFQKIVIHLAGAEDEPVDARLLGDVRSSSISRKQVCR